MFPPGKCLDNAPMEDFGGILKSEIYYLYHFYVYDQFCDAIAWLLEANKNGDHLLIVLAFLFSLFCLLDWGHFTHRRFATRYEKRPCLFFALTLLAAILVWIP